MSQSIETEDLRNLPEGKFRCNEEKTSGLSSKLKVGQKFETLLGETIEVSSTRDKCVTIEFPDRTPVREDSDVYFQTRSKASFVNSVNYEGMKLLASVKESDERMNGTFKRRIPCPECHQFMGTGYDGEGFPTAQCSSDRCGGWYDVDELIQNGYFVEG